MGNIGDKICAQRLDAGQFLYHAVKIVNGDVKAILGVQSPDRLDAYRQIASHDLLRSGGNPPDRPRNGIPAPDTVNQCAKQTDEHHIAKGELCRAFDIFLGEHNSHAPLHFKQEQLQTAGGHKGDQQKKRNTVPDRTEQEKNSVFPHFNTAL